MVILYLFLHILQMIQLVMKLTEITFGLYNGIRNELTQVKGVKVMIRSYQLM